MKRGTLKFGFIQLDDVTSNLFNDVLKLDK